MQLKSAEKKKTQEDIVTDGLGMLEDAIEQNSYNIINIKGLERKGKDDEFAKMIRYAFDISKFEVELI